MLDEFPPEQRRSIVAALRRNYLFGFFLSLLIALGIFFYLIQLQEQHRAEATARNVAAQARFELCTEVEALKANERAEAEKSFRELDATLKLLNIERTPEIVRLATENYERKLRIFAPIQGGCSALIA